MSSKLWGGRFTKKTNPLVEEFTKSIHFDKKLAECDCIGSLVQINILKKANLLTVKEHKILREGLDEILASVRKGKFRIDESFEDIHTYIQHLLEKKVGKVALKLHTCRSRNDQVVFDMKFYCLERLTSTMELIASFQKSLAKMATDHVGTFMPGYTHLQHAIPIHLVTYLSSYMKMFHSDWKRLKNIFNNIELTLGAGALAGTFIESRHYNEAVKLLFLNKKEWIKPSTNSIYTVSDRDFVIEILSALSILGMHLSRLSEDFILWSTKEFDFINIDESFCTGSSLMPQKKNPDVLELIRGYTGKLYGNLLNVLVMMKGLPMSYNRDMQHDKEPLFDSFEIVQSELKVLTELLKNVTFKKSSIEKQLDDESLYATDLSDYLVQQGVAFKEAHTIIGRLIAFKLKKQKDIIRMSAEELKQFHPLLTPAVIKKLIDPEYSVNSKKSVRKSFKKV